MTETLSIQVEPPPLTADGQGNRPTRLEHAFEYWRMANQEAIDAYNHHMQRDGLWSDGLRPF